MEIHKPKPWHGVREFLKEYVIIVVGVLTALGAEQVAETLNWRHEVAEARQSLQEEASDKLADAMERVTLQACLSQKLARLSQIVLADGATPTISHPYRVPYRLWRTSAYDGAVSSGAIAHMTEDARNAYTRDAALFQKIGRLNEQELLLASDLQSLRVPTRLSDAARDRLSSDIARLDEINRMIAVASQQGVDLLHARGVKLTAEDAAEASRSRTAPCLMPDANAPAS